MCWKIAYKGRKVAAAITSTAYWDLLRRRPLPLHTRVSTHRAQARTAPARAAAIGRLKAEARRSSLARDCRSNSKRQYGPPRRDRIWFRQSQTESANEDQTGGAHRYRCRLAEAIGVDSAGCVRHEYRIRGTDRLDAAPHAARRGRAYRRPRKPAPRF